MKPRSLSEASVQARSIWVTVTGRALSPLGGAGRPGARVVTVATDEGGESPAAFRARTRKAYVCSGSRPDSTWRVVLAGAAVRGVKFTPSVETSARTSVSLLALSTQARPTSRPDRDVADSPVGVAGGCAEGEAYSV